MSLSTEAYIVIRYFIKLNLEEKKNAPLNKNNKNEFMA